MINKIIGVYDRAEDIDFSRLPKSFVLKAAHGAGWNIHCPHKTQLNERETLAKLRQWLKDNYYYHDREWCYKHVQPHIICEAYIHSSEERNLQNYKVFYFNGEPKYIQVDIGRHTKHTRAFYDSRCGKQPFTTYYSLYLKDISKLKQLEVYLKEYDFKLGGELCLPVAA